MKPVPDISIITVNYNGLSDTCSLIESLHRHLHSLCYEIIVVDNGSTENEARQLQARFPNIKTIRSDSNTGFAGGNNLGIRQAEGKYLLFLNNDTYITDDGIHYLCDTLQAHPELGGVSPKIRFATPPQRIQFAGYTPLSKITLRNRLIGFNENNDTFRQEAGYTPYLHGAAMMLKRETIQQVGLLPTVYFLYYEELDWCAHITRMGYRLWYEPRCTVYHKESASTGQNSVLKTYYLTRNRLLYAWRNRTGGTLFLALLYQLTIANPKNIIVHLLKGKWLHAKAIFKGCIDFYRIKNKK